ncbi:hypothetical protein BOO24_19620 [Vibrio navarrensis]|uniref:hypothetical protein n=1 Tax=Vibrio navarrensis TaxID=29495 RepID=UPI001869956F|nr:hypothetical protein [Vibrio navarrensis]EIA0767003.1 hypothetical protein [Vibrio cholerae]MBE3671341.1 hypothetical protein [Vibrio navarrensis]MBE4594544.1 hypothetical protein [Vibrio navarrensis]
MILLELLVLIASSILVGMWINEPAGNYEPIVVALSLVLVSLEVYRRYKTTHKSTNSRDVELFEKYKDVMFTSGLIDTLEQHDFLSPLYMSTWQSLSWFVEKADGIDQQFSDKKLNKSYLKAYDAAFEFAGLISKYTVPMKPPMSDCISVYGAGYKEKPIKEHEKQQAHEINEARKKFVKAQKEFVVFGNRHLY